ncbi:MAG: site-2 protease family protein [Candidatus Colwellbacteria bacterium]|nr:site-2 protease family protein [Candidatus Colwellbacteria bacterium]
MLILTFIGLIGLLIIGHEFGHFIAAKLFKLKVEEFGIGFPPRVFSKKIGETKYSINAVPFGGFVKIFGENKEQAETPEDEKRSFAAQPIWKKTVILVAGVAMNFLIGWLALSAVFAIGTEPKGIKIISVLEDSPAMQAGLKPGEIITGFESLESFQTYLAQNEGKAITLNSKEVTPRTEFTESEGRIGVTISETMYGRGVLHGLKLGFTTSVYIIGAIFQALGGIVISLFNGGEVLDSVAGPVGIFGIVKSTSEMGTIFLVQLAGILSLNLAVFNILPIPALDGGRLSFVVAEKILGRRLNQKTEYLANAVGFGLLILLAIIVTISDIAKLLT